jgi:hypothetical protein
VQERAGEHEGEHAEQRDLAEPGLAMGGPVIETPSLHFISDHL